MKTERLFIWNYSFYCIGFSVPSALCFLWARDLYAASSCLLGGMFSSFLILTLGIITQGFLGKKSVAIAGSVIVFKYAIFGIFLYAVISIDSIHNMAFLSGFLSFLPATVIWVFKLKKNHERMA